MANNNVKNDVAVLGIDLAKQSFQLHGVDSNGVTVLKKKLARKTLLIYSTDTSLQHRYLSLRRRKLLATCF